MNRSSWWKGFLFLAPFSEFQSLLCVNNPLLSWMHKNSVGCSGKSIEITSQRFVQDLPFEQEVGDGQISTNSPFQLQPSVLYPLLFQRLANPLEVVFQRVLEPAV